MCCGGFIGHIFNPVVDPIVQAVETTVKNIIDNPLPTIETLALTALGVPAPIAAGAVSAANGGSVEDIAKAAGGTYVASEAGAAAGGALPPGTDPNIANIVASAAGGGAKAAVTGGDIVKGALIGGAAQGISDQITSTPAPGTPTTDPYPRGDISTTGMDEPGYEAPPDQGGVPTPPEASSDPSLPPDQGGVPTPPPASVNPDLPPAPNMEEVVVEDTKLPQGDEAIMALTGIMPSKTKMPVPTSPVTSKDLADPTVDNAPPPDKKSDYTGEISALLRSLFRKDSGSGSGVRGGASGYELGGGSTGPSSAALAGALRTDAGAPIFGGEKKGKKRNVWNIESLRTKDETGA